MKPTRHNVHQVGIVHDGELTHTLVPLVYEMYGQGWYCPWRIDPYARPLSF
jgi:hypothetical protein